MSVWDRFRRKDSTIAEEGPAKTKSWDVSDPAGIPPNVLEALRFGGWNHESEIYRRQPAVRVVVDFLGRNIAQLNPKVYERAGDDDRRELNDHGLARQLREPNPRYTRFRHMRDTVSDIAIYDRAFWVKQRSRGRVVQVVRIAPPKMMVEKDTLTGEETFRLTSTGRIVPREDLVVFQGYSPDGSSLGTSPMQTLRQILAESYASVQNRENMWRNASRQQAVIERPADAPEWGDPERTRFRSDWEAMMSGAANSGRTAILEDGMKLNSLNAFSAKEMEYIAGRKLTYEEVALAYGGMALATLVVGAGQNAGVSAVDSYHRQLYQDVFGPWLREFQDEIELQLLPDFADGRDVYVEFNLAEKLKGSFEEQASVLATATGVPFTTVNDARSRLNMPRIDNDLFDMPVMPMNVMYGGQQSTQEPTEDPSTPPGLLSRTPKAKAVPPAVVSRWESTAQEYEKTLRDHFAHQERSLLSTVKAKASVAESKWESWNKELGRRLYELSVRTTTRVGQRAAAQIDGVYDPAVTLNYLDERTRIASEGINATTRATVEEALASDEPAAALEQAFAVAKGSRAAEIGAGLATAMIAFSRVEAGKQSTAADGRERVKTWIVTSGNSRHPEMNNKSVPVGEKFSNGADWPGDPALGFLEVVNCRCLLLIS